MGRTIHGRTYSPEWQSWMAMRVRTRSKTASNYERYGTVGVRVCKRWMRFMNFLKDMGSRPPGTTLDRIDNAKGYVPSNCRWATPKQQANNRKNTRRITYRGFSGTVREVARRFRVNEGTVWVRLLRGWEVERALERKDHRRSNR